MSKPEFILKYGNTASHVPEVSLNHKQARTLLLVCKEYSEEKIAGELEEPPATTRTRIQRLYDICGIDPLPGRKLRTPDQLANWAICKRLVCLEEGEHILTSYHYVGAGRQLELEFEY